MIQGLVCAGNRKTTRIPAGRIGNEAPIVAVNDTWFSPDIEAIVDSVTRDPRFGTIHYQLQHVERKEQAAELFRPPSDYKLESVEKP